MKNIKPLDSLKQIVNERFDMFGEKTAFIEKFDGDKEFSNISYNRNKFTWSCYDKKIEFER